MFGGETRPVRFNNRNQLKGFETKEVVHFQMSVVFLFQKRIKKKKKVLNGTSVSGFRSEFRDYRGESRDKKRTVMTEKAKNYILHQNLQCASTKRL